MGGGGSNERQRVQEAGKSNSPVFPHLCDLAFFNSFILMV